MLYSALWGKRLITIPLRYVNESEYQQSQINLFKKTGI